MIPRRCSLDSLSKGLNLENPIARSGFFISALGESNSGGTDPSGGEDEAHGCAERFRRRAERRGMIPRRCSLDSPRGYRRKSQPREAGFSF